MKLLASPSSHPNGSGLNRALTLLELLVVIAILAVLTTMTARSLLTVNDRVQFDANEALAKSFRRALIGTPGTLQSDGTPAVSGLIADLGRPTRAELEGYIVGENEYQPSPTGQAYTVRELIERRTAPAFSFYRADINTISQTSQTFGSITLPLDDPNLTIPTGWKGPYLQGSDSVIEDAWAKPVAAYSVASYRRLIDFWVTSYDDSTSNPVLPTLNPFTFSLAGYHPCIPSGGNFMKEVLGIIITPGPASVAGNSLSLSGYSNVFSAGVVFTNEYVSQLSCTLHFNTNGLPTIISTNNYYFLAGVVLYGPNPHYNTSLAGAYKRPLGVSWVGTAATIDSVNGAIGGNSAQFPDASFPNSPTLFFADNPVRSDTAVLLPVYPLVHGTKVVRPFLLAQRKSTAPDTLPASANWWGQARTLTLRPGYNSVQLTLP